jgi:hypothetical protein
VGLVGVPGVDGEGGEHAAARLREREKPLEAQGSLERLGSDPQRRAAATPQLALGDVQQRRQRADIGGAPRHQARDHLGDERVGVPRPHPEQLSLQGGERVRR